jgi:formylglycine-generating enzyme required for sulfatase activity
LAGENITSIKDQLYVVGLASQISTEGIDNISIIKENLEKKFLLDYLTVDFNGESEAAAGKVLSANYLVPMLLLDEHYRAAGQKEKADRLEVLIRKLATQNGKGLLVDNFLNRNTVSQTFVPFKLDLKSVEASYKLVKDNVYAGMYEVTNKEYNEFLDYLMQNKMDDIYERCKIQLDKYEEPALSFMRSYHAKALPNKKNKHFSDYPVVNISFDAANAYCEWLSEQYNNTADRKYRKVKFRLPSVREWQLAATGFKHAPSWNLSEIKGESRKFEPGREVGKKFESIIVTLDDPQVLYPWWNVYSMRNTPLNSRGCSMGNFKFPPNVKPCLPEKMSTPDGFYMASSVGAYFPNGIGLYDVVGNVAEMSNENGSALGGSWNHAPEESTIKSINKYDGPSANIGFRIFMQVLEQ